MTYETFVEELSAAFPEMAFLEPDLPHVSMGQLVVLLKDARSTPDRFNETAERALAFIDRAGLSEDDRVVNLVAVSFLESLHNLGPQCREIANRLGPGGRRARKQVSGEICPS